MQSLTCWSRFSIPVPKRSLKKLMKILPLCRLPLLLQRLLNVGRWSKIRLWLSVGWRGCLLFSGVFTWSGVLYRISNSFHITPFREESEKVSELKSVTGSSKLPYGTLASGSEGIKEAISGFDDAYVLHCFLMEFALYPLPTAASRISRMNACPLNSLTRIPKRVKQFYPPNPQLLPNLQSHLPRFLQTA